MKVAEARDLEVELQRMREENADLRKRLNEVSSLEAAKKKADTKIEQLETKVCTRLETALAESLFVALFNRWKTLSRRKSRRRKMSSMRLMMRRYATTKNGQLSSSIVTSSSNGFTNLCQCSEQDLQRQVALAKSQLKDLRTSNESNQAKLLDHTQRQGQ